jgi:predicted dehydrogenase
MLEKHPEIEAVVIAVPLSQHFKISKYCLEQGKHVLSEKLMCWSVKECKDLIKFAKDKKKLLAVGHQRHYSALYDNSNFLVKQGILGDIKFIRAQWHRNTSFDGRDSWRPGIPKVDQKDEQLKQLIESEGYDSLEQLCRWRLYNKTGGGLMAELGSHQLDACSIFLGKVRPIAVQGYGGKNYFGVNGVGTKAQQKDNREVDDHVYVTIEFPGPHYKEDKNDKVIVTYSSINTNSLEPYGETLFGSRGTMMVHNEQETLLFKEAGPGSPGGVEQRLWLVQGSGGSSVVSTSESLGPATQASVSKAGLGKVSRGYTEEMEHFCYAVRNAPDFLDRSPQQGGLKCNGEVAMADAIMAFASNLAMDAKRRITFKDDWFDYTKDATPETDPEIVAWIKEAKKG